MSPTSRHFFRFRLGRNLGGYIMHAVSRESKSRVLPSLMCRVLPSRPGRTTQTLLHLCPTFGSTCVRRSTGIVCVAKEEKEENPGSKKKECVQPTNRANTVSQPIRFLSSSAKTNMREHELRLYVYCVCTCVSVRSVCTFLYVYTPCGVSVNRLPSYRVPTPNLVLPGENGRSCYAFCEPFRFPRPYPETCLLVSRDMPSRRLK